MWYPDIRARHHTDTRYGIEFPGLPVLGQPELPGLGDYAQVVGTLFGFSSPCCVSKCGRDEEPLIAGVFLKRYRRRKS